MALTARPRPKNTAQYRPHGSCLAPRDVSLFLKETRAMAHDKNELMRLVGHIGRLSRWDPDNTEAMDDAKRELATAKMARYIEETVAQAPPLTAEQRDRLAALITKVRPSGGDAA